MDTCYINAATQMELDTKKADDAMFAALETAAGVLIFECEHGEFPFEELCSHFVGRLPPEILAHLLMQFPALAGETLNKKFWLTVGETLGPDHAQMLYHGAVFATKVA